MPEYRILDTDTGKEWLERMGIQEAEDYLAANPHVVRLINGAPAIGDPIRLGRRKPDDGFRDVLRNVKKHHRRSTINTW
jgi:hypothetical protein